MKLNLFSIKRILMLFFILGFVLDLMAQKKVYLDTLTIDQLNQYKEKAVTLRNTGRALTLSGVGVMVTGFVTGVILLNTPNPHPEHPPDASWAPYFIIGIGGLVGIPCTVVGIPLWAVGGSRKAKAELTLQKFNIAPENSTAVGLGITVRF